MPKPITSGELTATYRYEWAVTTSSGYLGTIRHMAGIGLYFEGVGYKLTKEMHLQIADLMTQIEREEENG